MSTRDHRSVGYRIPKEWGSLDEGQRGMESLAGFKRESRRGFLAVYGAAVCTVRGCFVCRDDGEGRGRGEAGD